VADPIQQPPEDVQLGPGEERFLRGFVQRHALRWPVGPFAVAASKQAPDQDGRVDLGSVLERLYALERAQDEIEALRLQGQRDVLARLTALETLRSAAAGP
jgi:hypothetical protein